MLLLFQKKTLDLVVSGALYSDLMVTSRRHDTVRKQKMNQHFTGNHAATNNLVLLSLKIYTGLLYNLVQIQTLINIKVWNRRYLINILYSEFTKTESCDNKLIVHYKQSYAHSIIVAVCVWLPMKSHAGIATGARPMLRHLPRYVMGTDTSNSHCRAPFPPPPPPPRPLPFPPASRLTRLRMWLLLLLLLLLPALSRYEILFWMCWTCSKNDHKRKS